ncbi:carbohydrate ABC transporter permease [Robinsoniella peoriensis]
MAGKSDRRMRRFAHLVMIIMSLCALFPFLLMISASLTDESVAIKEGFNIIPQIFSLSAYKYLMQQSGMIFRAYGITILVTVCGTTVSLVITSLFGYGLTKKILGQKFLMFYVVFTMLFNGGLVPTYMVYTKFFGISNTIWALMIPNLLMSAFNVILVRNYFNTSIPESLIESAKLDGAGEIRVFWEIVIPLSKPILATIGLMTALGYWNDWQNGLYYLDDAKLYSIQNVLNAINNNIAFLSQMSTSNVGIDASNIPTVTARMAIAVIGILPMLAVYPFFQKYFIKGITLGGVKG